MIPAPEKVQAAPVGRPKKSTKDLPPDWKDLMLSMAKEGFSDVEIRVALCRSNGERAEDIRGLWYRLKERDEEFRATLILCRELQEAWWTAVGRTSLHKQFFQHQTWFANMKNRFGWRDRTEIEHDIADPLLEKFKTVSNNDLINEAKGLARIVLATGRAPISSRETSPAQSA